MKKKWKQAAATVLLTMLLYLMIPMLSALMAVNEWADTESFLVPALLAAGISAGAGTMYLVRRGKWSVFYAALLTGVGVPLLTMLTGYLIFGSASLDGKRWLLPLMGFASAVIAGLLGGQRKGSRKDRRNGKRKHR